MKIQTPLARAAACLLLAASSVQAYAQQAADPEVAVPATSYQSPLAKPAEATPTSAPDANWVKSNETVAAMNSMALTMKPMASQAADPHAGHAMHEHAAMQGMDMGKQDGGKSPDGKMSCCQPCCCKDKMKKAKEAK